MNSYVFDRDKEWDFVLEMFPIVKDSDNILWKELYYTLQCILSKEKLNEIDKEIYFSTKRIFLYKGKNVKNRYSKYKTE